MLCEALGKIIFRFEHWKNLDLIKRHKLPLSNFCRWILLKDLKLASCHDSEDGFLKVFTFLPLLCQHRNSCWRNISVSECRSYTVDLSSYPSIFLNPTPLPLPTLSHPTPLPPQPHFLHRDFTLPRRGSLSGWSRSVGRPYTPTFRRPSRVLAWSGRTGETSPSCSWATPKWTRTKRVTTLVSWPTGRCGHTHTLQVSAPPIVWTSERPCLGICPKTKEPFNCNNHRII